MTIGGVEAGRPRKTGPEMQTSVDGRGRSDRGGSMSGAGGGCGFSPLSTFNAASRDGAALLSEKVCGSELESEKEDEAWDVEGLLASEED